MIGWSRQPEPGEHWCAIVELSSLASGALHFVTACRGRWTVGPSEATHVVADHELHVTPKCGGCGRALERAAALAQLARSMTWTPYGAR